MKLIANKALISDRGANAYHLARWNEKQDVCCHRKNHVTMLNCVFTAALAFVVVAASDGHAQEIDGERLFGQRCSSCHSLESGQNRTGPSLAGVNGRTAGSVEGARYSPALRDFQVVWNAETLDRFLANPRQFVPGTTMPISITNEAQRRALVDFLTTPR